MKYRVLSVAVREVVEAIAWYQERSASAATDFVTEYERAVNEIKAHPNSFSKAEWIQSPRDIRQFLMRKFPYIVYYELARDEIVVLAVSHAAREPGYWMEGRT